MNKHPLATSVATAVADRALDRLSTHLTDEIRLRALLPGGSIEDDVGDRVLVHYKLTFDPDGERRVLSQTVVCSVYDGLVGRMDLVCSGFRAEP